MKKLLLPVLVLLSALVVAGTGFAGETSATASSFEGTKVLVQKGLPRELVEGDALVKKHCTGCHTEGRIMTALQAMNGEQTEVYEKQLKSIILRKIRMTNGGISRQDGKKIIEYLATLRQRQKPIAIRSVPYSQGIAGQRSRQASVHTLASPS
jgi:hypothetical protein